MTHTQQHMGMTMHSPRAFKLCRTSSMLPARFKRSSTKLCALALPRPPFEAPDTNPTLLTSNCYTNPNQHEWKGTWRPCTVRGHIGGSFSNEETQWDKPKRRKQSVNRKIRSVDVTSTLPRFASIPTSLSLIASRRQIEQAALETHMW